MSNLFLTQLSLCFMVSSYTVVIIMLIKKIFHNQLSAKWQHHIWYFLFLGLMLPFIPSNWIDIGEKFTFTFFNWNSGNRSSIGSSISETAPLQTQENWIQDFTVSVNQSTSGILNTVIGIIWISGICLFSILTLIAWFNLRKIKQSISEVEHEEYWRIFEQSKQKLNISKRLIIGESPLIKSPMTFGIFKTYIVLPTHFDEYLSKEDINHIFLHELNHYKYNDIVSNYGIVFFQIIYWFNPLIWFAFREMKLDREIACDMAVLKSIESDNYSAYGKTILRFIDFSSKLKRFSLENQLNGSKKQITKRIRKIAAFQSETKQLQRKSITIFLLVGIIIMGQIPFISAMAVDHNKYQFNSNKAEYVNLDEHFKGYDGSFVLYNTRSNQYEIHNKDLSTTRISPDSTYKIYSALIALESNVISPSDSYKEWDGTEHPYEAWNNNQDLSTAMTNSVNWYFQEIDKNVGIDTIHSYVKQINYGNQDLSGGIEQYWLESSLRISPVEQVQLLNAFYTNQFGFNQQNIETVKSVMKLEEKNGSILFGKTGTGTINGKDISGWFIGFVETTDNTYIYATNIQSEANSNGSTAAEITLAILNDLGIY